MPFEPKMHFDPKHFDPKTHRPFHNTSRRLNETLQGGLSMDVTDLPDELAALATQLADDAAMLEATFPGAPPAAFAEEARDVQTREAAGLRAATEELPRHRLVRSAWTWTRVAALFVIAAGATSAAIWQWQIGQMGPQAAIPAAIAERALPGTAPHVATVSTSSPADAESPGDTEASGVPTVISLEVAVGLSGEKIEVLADAFAAAAVEI